MTSDQTIRLLRRHEDELRGLGVVSLSLFGSVARGEANSNSDIDVAVRLEQIQSGFATLARLDQIKQRLSELLGTPVDVIPEPEETGPIKASVEKDRRVAF